MGFYFESAQLCISALASWWMNEPQVIACSVSIPVASNFSARTLPLASCVTRRLYVSFNIRSSIFTAYTRCKNPWRQSIASLSHWLFLPPEPQCWCGGSFYLQTIDATARRFLPSLLWISFLRNVSAFLKGCRLFVPWTAVAKLISLSTVFPK